MTNLNALLGKLNEDDNAELFQLLWDSYLTDEQKGQFAANNRSTLSEYLPSEGEL